MSFRLFSPEWRAGTRFNLAAFLINDCGVSDDVALAALQGWDVRNAVPKGQERLRVILANAHTYGHGARG